MKTSFRKMAAQMLKVVQPRPRWVAVPRWCSDEDRSPLIRSQDIRPAFKAEQFGLLAPFKAHYHCYRSGLIA